MHLQHMAPLAQCFNGGGGNARFDHDFAAELLAIGKTRFFHRSLNVHVVVDDVGNELGVSQRLIQSAHDAEADVLVTSLHEGGNDGMEWPLAAGKRIGRRWVKREKASAIL